MERHAESKASHAEDETADVEGEHTSAKSEDVTAATTASVEAEKHTSVSNEENIPLLKYQKLPPLRLGLFVVNCRNDVIYLDSKPVRLCSI